jgi:hypothetical protein
MAEVPSKVDVIVSMKSAFRSNLSTDCVRWNYSKRNFEYWNGTEWVLVGGSSTGEGRSIQDSLSLFNVLPRNPSLNLFADEYEYSWGKVPPQVTFTRNSSATYWGPDGVSHIAAAGEPRIDHNPVTGECLGWLREPQRTNFINNVVVKGVGTDGAHYVEPSANYNFKFRSKVYKYRAGTPTNTQFGIYITGIIPKENQTYFSSIFFRCDKNSPLSIINIDTPNYVTIQGGGLSVDFNFKTNTIIRKSATITENNFGLEDVGAGWFRAWFRFKGAENANLKTGIRIYFKDSTGLVTTFDGDGKSTFWYACPQMEEAEDFDTKPTSPIPTEGTAQVTRAEDKFSINNGITFTRASQATYFDAEGYMRTVGNDVERPLYDNKTGKFISTLIETQRTNYATTAGISRVTKEKTQDKFIGPALKLTLDATLDSYHYMNYRLYTPAEIPDHVGEDVTFSLVVKPVNHRYIQVKMGSDITGTTGYYAASYDIETCSLIKVIKPTSSNIVWRTTIEKMRNGWVQVSIGARILEKYSTGTISNYGFYSGLYFADATGNTRIDGDSFSSILVGNIQTEIGIGYSSYIPIVNNTATTRAMDNYTNVYPTKDSPFLFNPVRQAFFFNEGDGKRAYNSVKNTRTIEFSMGTTKQCVVFPAHLTDSQLSDLIR